MNNNQDNLKGKKTKMKKEIKDIETEIQTELIVPVVQEELVVPVITRPVYVEPTYGSDIIDYDDVYDEGDIASALEMGFIAKALAEHKSKVAPESHPDFDGEHCIDCDVGIHVVRLNMGKIRCVDCQSELELRNKLKGIR